MAKKKKAKPGKVSGRPGLQTFVGGETGVFPPRVVTLQTGGRITINNLPDGERFTAMLEQARLDAACILTRYVGPDWETRYNEFALHRAYLSSGEPYTWPDGVKQSIPPLAAKLRETLTQVELEQVLDALELHDEADWLPRVLARYGLAMDAVARGIAFGQLWQQMLFREFEAAAAAGLRVHSGAKRGGATRAAFTEVEREAIRASYSQMLREDRGATESQETLAAQYGVNPKTIQRIVNA